MRSPRASMKMAGGAVATPARRWQAVQSISSRASAAKTRSPFESSPGGPPSGPASAARPPSRATATAALAAQPPLTMKKLCAWVFASGCGKRSTRNTSSSTMIPAHKIARAPLPALAELNLFLHSRPVFNRLDVQVSGTPQIHPQPGNRVDLLQIDERDVSHKLKDVSPTCSVIIKTVTEDICNGQGVESRRHRPEAL